MFIGVAMPLFGEVLALEVFGPISAIVMKLLQEHTDGLLKTSSLKAWGKCFHHTAIHPSLAS